MSALGQKRTSDRLMGGVSFRHPIGFMAAVASEADGTELIAQGLSIGGAHRCELLGLRLKGLRLFREVRPLLPDGGLCSSRRLRAAWWKLCCDLARHFMNRTGIGADTVEFLIGAQPLADRKQALAHILHQYHAVAYDARRVLVPFMRQRGASQCNPDS